jgi:hypothetical protein
MAHTLRTEEGIEWGLILKSDSDEAVSSDSESELEEDL